MILILVGLCLVLAGAAATWRFERVSGLCRSGPWPGLTPKGAGVLLGCALLLAGSHLLTGQPRRPMPDVPILGLAAFVPLLLAVRLVNAPGAAAATCGAYLLPRTLVSLVDASVEPPPLLLVPALAFEVTTWLRASDLRALTQVWPRRQRVWHTRDRRPRQLTRSRSALGGAIFGLVLGVIEPPFAVLLGADPAVWSGTDGWLAGGVCAAVCAVVGALFGAPQRPR